MKPAGAKSVSADSPDDRIRKLQRMLEAARFLGSTLDLRKLSKIILQVVRREAPVDRVTAFMIDRESQVLRALVPQGARDVVIEVPIGTGIAGAVAQTNEALDVSDAQNDPRFYSSIDHSLGYHTRDILCLPIRNRTGDVVGALELLNRGRSIDELEKAFLTDISVHIGLALESAWSHRKLIEREKLERELNGLRERLIQLDRVRLMGEMLGGVMHDLNNPLAVLVGNVELLKIQLEANSQASGYLDKIGSAADRSSRAIRKFMRFTQVSPRKRGALDLSAVMRQVISVRRYDWQLAGILADPHLESIPAIVANEEELQLVFLTILKNAEEAAQKSRWNPRIGIRSSHDPETESVRVEIADNGPGIAPDLQSQIFEPFFTTKRKGNGTGLGLTTARRIIEEHGGRITFQTKPDGGTTFTVELPCGNSGEKP